MFAVGKGEANCVVVSRALQRIPGFDSLPSCALESGTTVILVFSRLTDAEIRCFRCVSTMFLLSGAKMKCCSNRNNPSVGPQLILQRNYINFHCK